MHPTSPTTVSLSHVAIYIVVSGGKSSVLLEVKPWDDETDMKKLEEAVRSVEMPGLLWGACMFDIHDLGFGLLCLISLLQ